MKQFNPLNLEAVIRNLEAQGIDELHFDGADGHFIPRYGFAPSVVASAKEITAIPCHYHLLVEQPDHLLDEILKSRADTVSIHLEACIHIHRTLAAIRDAGTVPGVAVSPTTSLTKINYLLPLIGRLLLVGADPVAPGRAMPRAAFERIRIVGENIRYHEYAIAVETEGTMPAEDAARCQRFGGVRIVVGPKDVPGLGDADAPEALRAYREAAAQAVHTV
jgi:ribulose-phosphate 3-epimerase